MLDLDTLDSKFSAIVKASDGKKSVAADLARAYNDYAKGGTIRGATCSNGGSVSLLEAAFTTDGTPATITKMATGICSFWDTVPKNGIPAHGGVAVVSVLPAFSAVAPAVAAAIEGCITTKSVNKPYKKFFKAIEDVLKTAVISITETMPTTPPTPSIFPENLS